MKKREHGRLVAAPCGGCAARAWRRAGAFACATALAFASSGAASTAYDGTWEEAWDDSARPGETAASASGAIASAFDSRVAVAMAAADVSMDSRFRDSEESGEGRLDTRPPAGFFIIVR